MAGITLTGIHSAGGVITGGGQGLMTVEGSEVAIIGDAVAPHGQGAHAAATMVTGSKIFFINKIAVCRAGDRASCNHQANGLDWFQVNA